MGHSRLRYRADIDGLRAVAVLSVLLHHAKLGLTGGYVGVDVFFVISGYLITQIILKDLQQNRLSLRVFWERRIRRILPALACVTAASAIAGWFILLPNDYARFGKSLLYLPLLLSNAFFWKTQGYFEPAAEYAPLLHTWSLAVEEQFYLVFPPLLLLLARHKQLRWTMLWLVPVIIVSFGLSLYGTVVRPTTAAFYLPFTRAWELLAGVLLALAPERFQVNNRLVREVVAIVGFGLIAIPCFWYDSATPFPGLAAVPPVLGAVLLIWLGGTTERLPMVNRCLSFAPIVFIGLISYSLYLWHWPIFVFARYANIFPLDPIACLGHSLLSIALAALSWRYVEQPFRRKDWRASRAAVWGMAAVAGAASILISAGITRTHGAALRLTPEVRRIAAVSRVDRRYIHNLNVSDVPDQLPTLGDPGRHPELLIWGDSHAMAVLPVLEVLCRERGVTARVAAHSSTAPALGYTRVSWSGLNEQAPAFNQAVLDYTRAAKIRTVLLVGYWSDYSRDPAFTPALLATIDQLRQSGMRVFVMKEVPTYAFDVPRALAVYRMLGRSTDSLTLAREAFETNTAAFAALLPEISGRGVTILDPLPLLPKRPGTNDLVPFDEGGVYTRDTHHLSTYGALALKPMFAPAFAREGEVPSAKIAPGTAP